MVSIPALHIMADLLGIPLSLCHGFQPEQGLAQMCELALSDNKQSGQHRKRQFYEEHVNKSTNCLPKGV